MKNHGKSLRNAVSFTTFRRMQLLAVKRLWSCLWTCDDVGEDVHFLVFGLVTALEDARFGDAVALSRSLSEQQYGDARSYRLGAQIVALVKKAPFKDPSLDPETTCRQKFLQAEEDCRATNEVLRPVVALVNGSFSGALSVADDGETVVRLLMRAQRHLRRVLGRKPDVPAMMRMGRFGSGSSVGVHGNATHLLRKLSAETWTVSTLCVPYAFAASAATPAFWYALGLDPREALHLWEEPMAFYARWGAFKAPQQQAVLAEFRRRWLARIEVVDTDLITYVPKDADCHRTVGIQPSLTSFCQLGVGDYLNEVLKTRCGIDLSTGQDRVNGPLAFLGSYCDGTTVSTLDLASASDTICRMVVKLLLPSEWYEFLNALRTPNYLFPETGEGGAYEKFCAMGNGFCFPLETLIFWSLVQAVYDEVDVPDRLMAVYGDDIIVYQPAALLLIELLEAAGFRTNTSKTFVFGPFRESCGQDYFNGINVRPVVLDEIVEWLGQAYHLVNSLRRKGYTSLSDELRELLPPDRIHMRPYAGDTTTALEVPWDVFMASRHARFHKDSGDEGKSYYHAWSWVELFPTPVMDDDAYHPGLHLSAALSGATAVEYEPAYAYRRKTKVRVREVAHG